MPSAASTRRPATERGDDPRLGDRGGDQVAAGRQRAGRGRARRPSAKRRRSAPPSPRRPGALAGEQEADPRRAAGGAQEHPAVGVQHRARAVVQQRSAAGRSRCSASSGLLARPPRGAAGRPARRTGWRPGRRARRRTACGTIAGQLRRSGRAVRRCRPRRAAAARQSCRERTSCLVALRDRGSRRAPSACSTTTWALMPPKPIEDTPARIGAPAGHSSARARHAQRRRRRRAAPGAGRRWPVAGGMTWWCTARIALISPATPAAALVWPMLPLTVLIAAGAARPGRRRAAGAR